MVAKVRTVVRNKRRLTVRETADDCGLKKVRKGHGFEATEAIKRNSTKTLLDIPKEEFAKGFQQWQKRWAKGVAAEWNYVEDN